MTSDRLANVLFDTHPNPAWIRDPKSLRILAANDAAVSRYGYGRDEFLGMTTSDLQAPEGELRVDPARAQAIEGALERHQLKTRECVLVRLLVRRVEYAGREAEVVLARDTRDSLSPTPHPDIQDLPTGDINLRAAQRLFKLGTWTMDIPSGQIWWSPEVHEIYGLDEGEFGGTYDDYVALVHPDDRGMMKEKSEAFMASDAMRFDYAHRIVTKSGEIRHVQGAAEIPPGLNRSQMTGVAQDVTELMEKDQDRQRSVKVLQMAGRVARFGAWRVRVGNDGSLHQTWSDETAEIHEEPPGFTPRPKDGINYYIPEHRPIIRRVFETCLTEGTPYDEVLQIETRAGKRVWVRTIGEAVRDDSGEIVAVQGAFQDISALKAAEERASKREEQYRDLFDRAPIGIFRTTSDGRVISVNPHFAELLGFPSADAALAHYGDLGQQLYREPLVRDEFLEALEAGELVTDFEYRARTAENRSIWLSMNARIGERLANGSFTIEGFVIDVTSRKEEQAARQRSERLLNFTGEIAKVGGWEFDIPTQSPYLTAETLRIYEIPPGSDLAVSEGIQYYHPEDQPRIQQAFERAIEHGEPYDMELRLVTAKGNTKWVQTIGQPKHPDGKVTSLIGSIQDISQRKLRENERAKLEAQYHQAQKMESVGRLAGGVAHDFNNVLTVILGECELGRRSLSERDPLFAKLSRIEEAGTRAKELTSQLLAFSRRQALRVEPLDLNELVRSMENMLRRLIGEDVIFEVALGEKIGVVRADRGKLEQVLMNLTVNARDAMPRGGRLIIETANVDLSKEFASEHASVAPGPHVMVAVSDTGVGMDAETRAAVFEPFFTTKQKGKGTGLGLATVYGIVKQSEGSIWVYSEPGKGATFKIYLPRRDAESVSALSREEPEASPGAGQQLLVVEDEGAIRELLEEMLQQLGYRVTIAANGGEALLAIEEQGLAPDLLITDVVMPGMGGAELSDRLRRKIPDIKVLYMSGYPDNAIVHHGVLDPGKQFLEKPFSLSQLSRAVAQALRDSGGEPS